MQVLDKVRSPQLEKLHQGKVRDSFRLDDGTRLIVVTDRISAFDLKLETPIAGKGEVLNRLAAFWFDSTRDIVENHLVEVLTEQSSIVREAIPIRVEMVVRGYMAGSMTRAYAAGKREISGVKLPEGLRENEKLPEPIVTPTTKEESDREITPAGLVEEGLVDAALYAQMEKVARALFARGSEVLASKGLLLCDTKYEMGLVDGRLVLIDEIHTPDSSRIWDAKRHAASPKDAPPLDKEHVRTYMLGVRERTGEFPLALPDDVLDETRARYTDLFRRVTGNEPSRALDPAARLVEALVAKGRMLPGFVAVVGDRDAAFVRRVRDAVERLGARAFVLSPEDTLAQANAGAYVGNLEPGAVLVGAGNEGLVDELLAKTDLPVLSASGSAAKSALSAVRALNARALKPGVAAAAHVSDDARSTKETP